MGIINVQKSVSSGPEGILFTLNLGAWSQRLASFFSTGSLEDSSVETRTPIIDDCHWRERIGNLLPEGEDKWWILDPETDMDRVSSEINSALHGFAIPAVESRVSDEGLRDEWLMDFRSKRIDTNDVMRLTVLLAALGPKGALHDAIRDLQAREQEEVLLRGTIQDHLRYLSRLVAEG